MKSVIGWTGVLAVALAGMVAAYGAYLVVLGPTLTLVTPGGAASTLRDPNPAGLAFILAAGLVWYGIQRGKQRWAWIGATAVPAFTVLFVFGPGGILIPPAIALVVVLIARRILGQEGQAAGQSEP